MKTIVNFPKRTNWFKASMVLIACLLFLIPPACEKPIPNQDPLPDMDEMVATPRAASTAATKVYCDYRWFNGDGNPNWNQTAWIESTGYYEHFENFVINILNVNGAYAKISKLEIRINNLLVLSAKGLTRDYFIAKTLRNFPNGGNVTVAMAGDPGCSIKVWITATFKGLGTAYGKHLYYRSAQNKDFWSANDYCGWFGPACHLVIINDAKENSFVFKLNDNRHCMLGLSDFEREQQWRWVDGTLCREVAWNYTRCPDPSYPLPWGDRNCTTIQDFGYNNWAEWQPDNCGGWNCSNPQNVAYFNNDGTWDDGESGQDNFIMEWEYMPSSEVIDNLFRNEYPEFPRPW